MNQAAEGVRLAKRVAALQACSRSQAEALIAAGAVQVQGQVVTDPARRVAEGVLVQVSTGAAVGAITVLLHKPAGMAAAQALPRFGPGGVSPAGPPGAAAPAQAGGRPDRLVGRAPCGAAHARPRTPARNRVAAVPAAGDGAHGHRASAVGRSADLSWT